MLTDAGCRTRRERLWNALEIRPDWIVIRDPQHLMYFAGYHQSPFEFRSSNAGAVLILGGDGSSALVADNLVEGFARDTHVDEVVAPVWYRGKESAQHREAMLVRSVLDHMQACPGSHIGYEAAQVPGGIVEGLRHERGSIKLTNVDATIHPLKRRKDLDELELIRISMRAGEVGQAAAMRRVKPGMTEMDVFWLVEEAVQRAAGRQARLYGDFVSGPRCENVGGPPTDRVIEQGDLVLVDFSVVVGGYRGDFANTFVCGAKPTAEQTRLYDACIDAITAGEQAARDGRPCREVDAAVRDSFDRQHLAKNFTSHSGHGLGLGHPDPPYLVPDSTDTLVAGDVIAIEPGQYIKGVAGMRYERNYLVTENGLECLSHHALQIDATA